MRLQRILDWILEGKPGGQRFVRSRGGDVCASWLATLVTVGHSEEVQAGVVASAIVQSIM